MKILFFDSLFPRGHISVNSRYISLLQNNNEIVICARPGWFDCNKGLKHIDLNWYYPSEEKSNSFYYRWRIFNNCLKIVKVIEEIEPDIVYIASYDIISFFYAVPFLFRYRNKIVLQEHNNVDQLENMIKNKFYSFYKNYFHHFVFEEYIKEKLIQFNVHEQLIHVVPHPLPNVFNINEHEKKLIVGLSNSNDDNIIKNLLKKCQNSSWIKELKYKIVVKAKSINYEDNNLKIFNGWITKDEYVNYCHQSSYYLIPFPKSYSYRVSAVFLEAVSNGKFILSSQFALAEYYSKRYPGLCQVFADVDEIPDLISRNNKEQYLRARKLFISDHSDQTITEKVMEELNEILRMKF